MKYFITTCIFICACFGMSLTEVEHVTTLYQTKPNITKVVIGKTKTEYLLSEPIFKLYFEDNTVVHTNYYYYMCFERGDTAVFIYKELKNKEGAVKWTGYQMYNKCPHELRL